MRRFRFCSFFFLLWILTFAAVPSSVQVQTDPSDGASLGEDSVRVVQNQAEQRVDVFVGEERFTSYIFSRAYDVLKKPVLYPIKTASGTEVTRGYPLGNRAGERVDHPHHIGLWLNYGNVNGLDFWNNSDAVSTEEAEEMGRIVHRNVEHMESGEGKGILEVTAGWLNPEGEPLLREETRFVFRASPSGARMIDRITTFTALDRSVNFTDNKEGFLGLRVTRVLEMPSDDPVLLTDASGEPAEESVMDNEGVAGYYRNSEGVEGYPAVWGKRAKWMTLSGEVKRTPVTVAIFDHPQNVGFPTYWHARDYGLFAANPLGQKVFSEGKRELNFSLAAGESTTFRYRVSVLPGKLAANKIESRYQNWIE